MITDKNMYDIFKEAEWDESTVPKNKLARFCAYLQDTLINSKKLERAKCDPWERELARNLCDIKELDGDARTLEDLVATKRLWDSISLIVYIAYNLRPFGRGNLGGSDE
jgi:hypothetical protein